MIFDRYANLKHKYVNRQFWCEGYYVDTPPEEVKIPGILVDYVVEATDPMACWQTEGRYFEPAFSGQIRRPLKAIPALSLSESKVIARRCAAEGKEGYVLNLGVGTSAEVGNILAVEGYIDRITMCCESGVVGGVPCALPNFGSSYNPEAVVEHSATFDIISGGGLDMTCLGMGECDEQITFSGKYIKPGQEVIYVTERCIMKLIDGRMTIVEIAPGIDIEKDILAHMDFVPNISPELRLMDPGMFSEKWGGLDKVFRK